jgi:hypothetical protein
VAEVPVVAARPVGEFVHVEHAELDRAGGVEALERRGRDPLGLVPLDARAARGRDARAVEHVLVRHRYAGERAERSAGHAIAIYGERRVPGALRIEAEERVDRRLHFARSRDDGFEQLGRREALRGQAGGRLREREPNHLRAHRASSSRTRS